MKDKYRNKYRIKSHRMPGWDYAGNGHYFITLITQNRDCNLGQVVKTNRYANVQLSEFGKIVDNEWIESFEIRDELLLDEYIIMPNHLHAIVVLNRDNDGNVPDNDNERKIGNGIVDTDGRFPVETHGRFPVETHGRFPVETHGRASLRAKTNQRAKTNYHAQTDDRTKNGDQIIPNEKSNSIANSTTKALIRKPQSISSFMGGFKSSVNTKIDDYIDQHQLKIPKYNRFNHFFQSNYHDHIIRNREEYQRIKNYIINNPAAWKNDRFNPDK